jgi:hypothetical protein
MPNHIYAKTSENRPHFHVPLIMISMFNALCLQQRTLWLGPRVDRVLSFFSGRRPNWDSPIPSLTGECVTSPPFGSGGGGGTLGCRRGGGGGGVPISTRGQTLWHSRHICTCWGVPSCKADFTLSFYSQKSRGCTL